MQEALEVVPTIQMYTCTILELLVDSSSEGFGLRVPLSSEGVGVGLPAGLGASVRVRACARAGRARGASAGGSARRRVCERVHEQSGAHSPPWRPAAAVI